MLQVRWLSSRRTLSLGLAVDSHLFLDEHVESVCKFCSFHIHALRLVRGLGSSVVKWLAAGANILGFDSPVAQHVHKLIFRALTYGGWFIGIELVLGLTTWIYFPSRAFELNCVITLVTVMCVHSSLAHQAIYPFGVGKLVPATSLGNNALTVIWVQLVAACTCTCNMTHIQVSNPKGLKYERHQSEGSQVRMVTNPKGRKFEGS